MGAHRRLVAKTILMNLDFTRESLAVQRRADKDLRKLDRPATLDLRENILLNDIRHFLLLLLALVNLLLEIGDLLRDGVEAVLVR